MLPIIQFVVYLIILPLVYIIILLFDINILRRARTGEERLQRLFGVGAGILSAIIVILLDQTTTLFSINSLPDASQIGEVWPFVGIAFLVGGVVMFVIHQILKTQQFLAFFVLLTVFAMISSIYFLLTISAIRSVVAVASLGFLRGIIIYTMLFPDIIHWLTNGSDGSTPERQQRPDWS